MPRPNVNLEELSQDMQSLYAFQISDVKDLMCYDDATFLFTGNGSGRFIAKYYNPSFTNKTVLKKILEVLGHLNSFNVPQPVPQSNGSLMAEIPCNKSNIGCKSESYLVLYTYIAGDLLHFQKKPPKFWKKLGVLLGEINVSMSKVKCDLYERDFPWNPLIVHKTLSEEEKHFPSEELPNIDIQSVIKTSMRFHENLKGCPKQFIHGDINEYNIIVGKDGEIGIIDFNDLIYCYRVFDVAHCIGYMMEAQNCDTQVARQIYEGCSSVIKLSKKETEIIYDIILCRFILSVTCGNKTINLGGANQYIQQCVDNNKKFLKKFLKLGKDSFNKSVLGL